MKVFIGTDIGAYTFAPGGAGVGTVTLTGLATLQLEQVLSILNVTTNEFIYLPPTAGLGGSIAANVVTLDVDTSSMNAADRLQILVDLPSSDIQAAITIIGASSGVGADVDGSKRLLVSTPPPTPPAGTTAQGEEEFSDVSGNNAVYTYFTIPNGETLTVQRFVGGSEGTNNESYVALWHDPTGTNATGDDGDASWDLITLGFTANSNFGDDLDEDFVGDETARIVLHRRRLDRGNRLMFARWSGFSQ